MSEPNTFADWVILELLGHRRLAGWLTEQQIAGASFLRLEIPGPNDEGGTTQYYSPGSVYAITPTTEQIARSVARGAQPAPVQHWELPALPGRIEDADLDDYSMGPGGTVTLYDLGGHPVSLEVTEQDLILFWAAVRKMAPSNYGEVTRAGLSAILPGLLDRAGAQLPSRCANCDHAATGHDDEGCLHRLAAGVRGVDLVCLCVWSRVEAEKVRPGSDEAGER